MQPSLSLERIHQLRVQFEEEGLSDGFFTGLHEVVQTWVEVLQELSEVGSVAVVFHEITAQVAGEISTFFAELITMAARIEESSKRYEVFRLLEVAVAQLTLKENELYRGRRKNTAYRTLLFLVSTDVGGTPVHGEEDELGWLDYRYSQEYGKSGHILKPGEIWESREALQVFSQEPTQETALDALVELGDVFYTILKLTQTNGGRSSLEKIMNNILKHEVDLGRRQRLEELFFTLTNIGIWKFWYRYEENDGSKDPEDEAAELMKRWSESLSDVDPLTYLKTHFSDCLLLLQNVARYCLGEVDDILLEKALPDDAMSQVRSRLIAMSDLRFAA